MANNGVKIATLARLPDLRSKYTDFTITCHDASWGSQRLVLAQHSKVLAVACDKTFKEGQDRAINLSDHTPVEINALVDYLYTFDYIVSLEDVSGQLGAHIGIIIVADKYDITGLSALALAKVRRICADETTDASVLCSAIGPA